MHKSLQNNTDHRHNSGKFSFIQISKTILFALVILLIIGYLYLNRAEFSKILMVKKGLLILLILAVATFNIINAIRFKFLYLLAGVRMEFLESFHLNIVATVMNYIMYASPGLLVRAIYLKRRQNLDYSKLVALMIGSLLLSTFVGGIVLATICISQKIFYNRGDLFFLIISFVAIAHVFILPIKAPVINLERFPKIKDLKEKFFEAYESFSANGRTTFQIGVMQFILYLISGMSLYLSFLALGIDMGFLWPFAFGVFVSLVSVVYILPGNLGLQEALIGYFTHNFGGGFEAGLSAAILLRLVSLAFLFAVAPLSWISLLKRGYKGENIG